MNIKMIIFLSRDHPNNKIRLNLCVRTSEPMCDAITHLNYWQSMRNILF